jgi:hypothetical protein
MLINGICRPRAMRHSALGLGGRARVGVWMLVSLMLLATLAPAISRARQHGVSPGERGWVEVCTSHGMVWVKPDADPLNPRMQWAAANAGLLQQLDACDLCALGIDRSTTPPDFSGWGLSLPLPSTVPALAGMGPGRPVLVALRARGPPERT